MKMKKLLKVMEKLRDPKNGCPWDKKQTLKSIIPHYLCLDDTLGKYLGC